MTRSGGAGQRGSGLPFVLLTAGDQRLSDRPDDLALAVEQVKAAVPSSDPLASGQVERARQQVLDFCAANDDALHRRCLVGHLTGSALVVDPNGTRTLLLHHAKLDRWLQPGGHADGDGNLAAVALREATEETGMVGLRVVVPAIDIDVHHIPARPGEPEHVHYDLRFVVIAPETAVVDHNEEALAARWIEPDDPTLGRGELGRAVRWAIEVARSLDRSVKGTQED